MILFKPYKHPYKRIFLTGRMRKVRRSDRKSTRAIANWFKRRKRY